MMPDDYEKYEQFIEALQMGMNCGLCSEPLSEDNVQMFDNENGIPVMGHLEKQWVYVQCSNPKCEYQWVWTKIMKRARSMGKINIP